MVIMMIIIIKNNKKKHFIHQHLHKQTKQTNSKKTSKAKITKKLNLIFNIFVGVVGFLDMHNDMMAFISKTNPDVETLGFRANKRGY